MNDNINPSYYKRSIEVIEFMKEYTKDLNGIEAICTGNVIKYISRWNNKNKLEDLQKANWYLNYLINYIENKGDKNEELN